MSFNRFLQIVALHLCWIINSASCLCGYPGRPAYGKLLSSSYLTADSSYNYGDTVNYACEKGYFLRGRGSRTCLNNTKWSGNLPICDSPLQIYGEASSPESIKLYPPSLAIDNNPRTCFYTRRSKPREWTLDLMIVRKVKSVIITVPFASSEHHFTIFMSVLSINNSIASSNRTRCSSFHGMFATQTQLIVCTEGVEGRYLTIQDDSSAYEYFGLCEVKVTTERDKYECGEPEKPLNSLPIETHRDNMVQHQCKEGYLLEGPTERHCQNDGFWSKGQAVCKEVTCQKLEAPLNSRMVLSGLNENSQATILSQAYFHCDPGFQIVGDNRLVCLSTGKWSNSIPQCIAIDCGLPKNIIPELSRFILLNGTTRFGSMALLECLNDQGLPETEVTIVCQQDGLWSQAYISCNKQDWLSSETFVKSQLDLAKSGNGNIITSMIIIILCALSMIIILLIALLLKRKFLSVKLVTWRDHDHSDGQRCKALRSKHKRLGATLCTVRKHLGLQSDLPLFASLKCSFPSLPMATSSEANMVTQSGLTVNSPSQGYGNCNVTDDAGKLININKYLDKHDSSKHECSDGSICVSIQDSYRSSYRNYQNLDEIEINETLSQSGLTASSANAKRITSTVEASACTVADLGEHALVSIEAVSHDWMDGSRKKSGFWKREKDRFKRQNIASVASLSSPLPSSSSSSGFPFSPANSSSFPSSSLLPSSDDLDLTCKRSSYILSASENTELDSSNNLVSQRIVQVDIELPLDVITGLVTSPSSSLSETTTTDSPSSSSSITSKPCASSNDKNNETANENSKVVDVAVYQQESSNPTTSACDLSKLPADKISTEKGITRMMMMIRDPIDNDITLDNGNEHSFDEKQTILYKHENNCDNKQNEVKEQLDQTATDQRISKVDDGRSCKANDIIKVNTNNSHGKQNSTDCSSNSQPYCVNLRSNSSPSTNDKLILRHTDNHESSICDNNMDISIITQKSYHSFSTA